MSLEIKVSELKRVKMLEVSGRVDSISADELREALASSIEEYNKIVIELSGVEYMSSAGLREMVSALKTVKKTGGDLRLANPSDKVKEVLELAGLDSIFQIYPTTVDAVGSF
jgi:anti-sigma B factor antagonist